MGYRKLYLMDNFFIDGVNMNTLEKVRKPVHNRCFGIEIEGLFDYQKTSYYQYYGFFYAGADASISRDTLRQKPLEMVSQPLPYKMLQKQIDLLEKKVGKWTANNSCGIHVHVSKTAVSFSKIKRLWNGICKLDNNQFQVLFGRIPNDYCHCRRDSFNLERYCAINTRPDHTYEFRMFASGEAAWAKECLRRTKIMCDMKGPISYDTLFEAFTNPENK